MARDWKLRLFLLSTFCVYSTVSFPKTEKGLEYYFYSPSGQKSSEEFLLRVKREEDENTNEVPNKNDNKKEDPSADVAADSVASSVTGTDTTKPITANLTSVAAVSIPNKVNTNISLTSNLPEQKNNEVPQQQKPFVTTDQIDRSRGYINETVATAVLKDIIDTDLNPHANFNTTIDPNLKTDHMNQSADNHKYYMSEPSSFEKSWIDLKEWNTTKHPGIVQEHAMLSKSYRRAATISLKFQFPFYGHMVKNITIATGGFLYTGEYVHSWLAATQYIAPLMANFDTSQEESATVKYADNGTTLVVEWGNVYLQGREGANSKVEGPFTFQAILHNNGDIIFAYKTIPVSISLIADEEHPVKVGLSDAYIIERTIFFVRRKTIYEYHRVNMKDQKIANNTAIRLKALPRCNMKRSCKDCLALTVTENDKEVPCMWCNSAKLCSDGLDRNKQNWLKSNCDKDRNHVSGAPEVCDDPSKFGWSDRDYQNPSYTIDDHQRNDQITDNYNSDIGHGEDSDHFKDSKSNVHHTGVALLTIVIILIITMFGWCMYAYFFPHTCSGQLLIKYRPSRCHWRRGEPRYTAASIHM